MSLRPVFMSSVLFCAGLTLILSSCEQPSTNNASSPSGIDSNSVSSSGTVKLEGQIISIPSPNQLAILIRQSNVAFQDNKLHDLGKANYYLSEEKKAMNLGLYGADLAYIANFEKGQLANDYYEAVGRLAGELEILDHIDSKLVSRLSSNVSNRDSVLRLSSQFFHSADKYLKNNKRSDLAGLILLGGWVESIHFALDAATTNPEIRKRVGEQKHACASLTNLLIEANMPALEQLTSEMKALNDIYSGFSTEYTYSKPITDVKERTTYITSKSSVLVEDKQLTALADRIKAIRSIIIQ